MSIANKIVVGLVGLTVMAVIFSAFLPVMGEVTSATDTLTNDGYMRYTSIDADSADTIVISWDHTKPSKMTINDVEVDIVCPSNSTISLAFADNFCFRYNTVGPAVDCYGAVGNTVSASVSDALDITLTLSSGTATVVNTDTTPATYSYTYTTAYYPDSNGAYIMKDKDKTAFVHPDTTIIVANGMTIVGSRIGVYFDGTIDNGYTFNYFNTGTTVTESNVNSDYSEVSAYVNLVALSKITMHITKGVDEVDATYSYFLVPYEITAEKAIHPDGPTTAILNMLPIIVGAGLLLGAIAFMIVTRK